MSKVQTYFICQNCQYKAPKWMGKCPDCNQWNTFLEETVSKEKKPSSVLDQKNSVPKKIFEIEIEQFGRIKTGVDEFDRVMGGGIVIGSLTLIGGEPGIGKSTLLMEVSGRIANILKEGKILYISGEESESQIASRSKRLGVNANNFYIVNETNWEAIKEHLQKLRPKMLVIDSIQTTITNHIESAPGTISQIREITYELMNFAKSSGTTCFMIGHVTKDGNIAGPKILEHMVDTVIYFEGDQMGQYRLLRSMKNRFGNTNEVGIFEMGEKGLTEVKNPSQFFIDTTLRGSYGRSITSLVEGTRSLLIEIQALVVDNKYGNGRRTTQGFDSNRLAMLVAVIEKYFGIPLHFCDIYLNVVGGIKVTGRESDLAVLASIISSQKTKPIPEDIAFVGEVGLTGEVRGVPFMDLRLKELAHLKFKKVITSNRYKIDPNLKLPLEVIKIGQASELLNYL